MSEVENCKWISVEDELPPYEKEVEVFESKYVRTDENGKELHLPHIGCNKRTRMIDKSKLKEYDFIKLWPTADFKITHWRNFEKN